MDAGREGMDAVIAGLFPGQGSHTKEMRAQTETYAPHLLCACIELVGEDPFLRVTESTRFAQPAIFCASIASLAAHRLATGSPSPGAYAGHSLGELAALVAADALDCEVALRLAVLRGALMAEAGERDGRGGMLALIGASTEQCERLAAAHDVHVANENAPGQTVLAGQLADLERVVKPAREEGCRAIMLDVAGAFHSPEMASALEPFRVALRKETVRTPKVPVISGATASPFVDVREQLLEAIVKPVRWSATMKALAALGANRFIDFGPGRVLARLLVRNVPDAEAIAPSVPAEMERSRGDHVSADSQAGSLAARQAQEVLARDAC